MKMRKTLVAPMVLTLTLNSAPKQGEGLQSGLPSPFWGEGVGG